jgi:hypothetical protein
VICSAPHRAFTIGASSRVIHHDERDPPYRLISIRTRIRIVLGRVEMATFLDRHRRRLTIGEELPRSRASPRGLGQTPVVLAPEAS